MRRNILIDANNLFHRAYAIHVKDKAPELQLTNTKGYPTGIIYGVYSMLQDWISDISNPTRIMFFMDGVPKRRLDIDPGYKAKDEKSNSPGMQDAYIELCDGFNARNEISVIFRIAYYLGIDVYYGREEEADDLMASFVCQNSNDVNILISSDKDFFQLLQKYPTTILYRPGVQGSRFFDAERASEHMEKLCGTRIEPKDILMFKALTGDPSDGIKGVPRLRKKVIAPLCKYETVEELLGTGLPGFSKKERINTVNLQDKISLNLQLIRLVEDLDIESFIIKSSKSFAMASRILENDLDIRAISVDSFTTISETALRSTPSIMVEEWLQDI